MDSLPLETLQRILRLACSDGGYTGYSLSLASRELRAVARTTRFHSVSLYASPWRIRSFVALYEREYHADAVAKPRIAHLHIAFPRIRAVSPFEGQWGGRQRSISPPPSRHRSSSRSRSALPVSPDLGPDSLAEDEPVRGRRPLANPIHAAVPVVLPVGHTYEGDPTASDSYLNDVQTLFRLAAPDLVSLAIQSGFSWGGDLQLPIFQRGLPNLRRLTLVGVRNPETLFAPGAAALPPFTALTSLHIVPGNASWNLSLPFWSEAAPNVVVLRVSGIDDEEHVLQLAQAAGIPLDSELYPRRTAVSAAAPGLVLAAWGHLPRQPLLPPRAYPSLRCMVVQAWAGDAGDGHDAVTGGLRRLEEGVRATNPRLEVVVLEGMRSPPYQQQAAWARGVWQDEAGIEGREWW